MNASEQSGPPELLREFWTREQVAEKLGLAPGTVKKMAIEGKLPSFKIGRDRYFSPEAIREWVRRRAEGK